MILQLTAKSTEVQNLIRTNTHIPRNTLRQASHQVKIQSIFWWGNSGTKVLLFTPPTRRQLHRHKNGPQSLASRINE